MSNKIIEISAQNATFKSIDNNVYNITFDPPIENGNILSFKQGYLDLRQLGNSANDSFILTEDVNCSITVSFYEQFLDNNETSDTNATRYNLADPTKAVNKTDLNFFGRHFVLCHFVYNVNEFQKPPSSVDTSFTEVNIVKEEINFTVPAGTYTSDSIVEYINDNIQNYNFGTRLYSGDGINFPETYTNAYVRFVDLANKYTKMGGGEYFEFLAFCRINENKLITDYEDPEFYAYYYQQDIETPSVANLMIGTPEINLQNINNKLSWQYLHNPVYLITPSPSKTKTEVFYIKSINTDKTQDLWYGIRRGGVNLVDFFPSTFWIDLLGFSNNNLLSITTKIIPKPFFDKINLFKADEFQTNNFIKSTTQPFIGLSDVDFFLNNDTLSVQTDYDPTLAPIIDKDSKPVPQTVNSTIPVNADNVINFADLSSGGHFQLQIETGFKVNNYQDAKTKKNLSAIMSREYLNNGYLSVFDGGAQISIPENTSLTTITLSIIDPITKKLAQNLGANNSFYFEID
jgi:hypothetical protein